MQANIPLDSELLYSGAEASIYKAHFLGQLSLLKQRKPKLYRHPQLEKKLLISRLSAEGRALARCQKLGIDVPIVYHVSPHEGLIWMELINGITVLKFLSIHAPKTYGIGYSIGRELAHLHNSNIIHGDLTTSNMMIRSPEPNFDFTDDGALLSHMRRCLYKHPDTHAISSAGFHHTIDIVSSPNNHQGNEALDLKICLIDFGLTSTSTMVEDKAVDLYVLEKAIQSTHILSAHLMNEILESYSHYSNSPKALFHKLNEVRLRGRKRSMVG